MIQILLADDHGIVREGLRKVIEESGEMGVQTEVADGRKAVEKASLSRPDVAVIDISMPGYDGLEVTGAMGYLTKSSAPEQLVKAIQKVYSGKRFLTEEGAEAIALKFARGASHKGIIDQLSTRELQVLRELAMGHTNKEIAGSYHIGIKTVDTYRHRLLKKLNLRNNADLSRFAINHNLIEA